MLYPLPHPLYFCLLGCKFSAEVLCHLLCLKSGYCDNLYSSHNKYQTCMPDYATYFLVTMGKTFGHWHMIGMDWNHRDCASVAFLFILYYCSF